MKMRYKSMVFLVALIIVFVSVILFSSLQSEPKINEQKMENEVSDTFPSYKVDITEDKKIFAVENYIDDETFLILKQIYEQFDFNGRFCQGDQSKTNLYKDQYNRFLKGEIPVLDRITGEEYYIYDYQTFKVDVELDIFDLKRYTYYFFDMDGDDNPELCIKDDVNSIFIIKYEEELDQIISWYEIVRAPVSILGTEKLINYGGNSEGIIKLNGEGEWEYAIWFEIVGYEDRLWYMVSLPIYYEDNNMENSLNNEIKTQGFYDEDQHIYYFLVTEEQYNELIEEYRKAVKASEEAIKEVSFTYDELFNGSMQNIT